MFKFSSSTMSDSPQFLRKVRSFVLREGRMTKGQQRAMDELFPKWGVKFEQQLIDMIALFGNDHPVVLEIGFGMGRSLAEQAQNNPQLNYLGIEVHKPGVGACLLLAEEYGLENLRVLNHDAVEVIEHMLGDDALYGLQVYFPDPWHKKKHHKRRIISPQFIERVTPKIQTQGFIHLATDWENYAEHMLQVMNDQRGWNSQSDDKTYVPRPDSRPLTKFEQRGHRLGHGVWDLYYLKF